MEHIPRNRNRHQGAATKKQTQRKGRQGGKARIGRKGALGILRQGRIRDDLTVPEAWESGSQHDAAMYYTAQ
jgi:hypothetical protein